jgi:chemotaxis signal transduction protein
MLRTARRRYAARYDDVYTVWRLASAVDLQRHGDAERAPIGIDLGTLFDPQDQSAGLHRHGLVVPIRRRNVVLLVEAVEDFLVQPQIYAVPAVLRPRLLQPWTIGAVLLDDQPVMVLDVRAVARSVMVMQSRPMER